MKYLKLKSAIVVLAIFTLFSCDDDSVPDGESLINYSVQVVPIGETDRGANNATVTVQSHNKVITKTVGQDGIAVFENLRPGKISGYVSRDGCASVNFTTNIANHNADINTINFASSTVYLPLKNSSVSGRFYGDFDLDGNTNLSDPGNFRDVTIILKYSVMNYPKGSGDGALDQVSLDIPTYIRVSNLDGRFNIDNLPNTVDKYLAAQIKVEDIKLTGSVGEQIIYKYLSTDIDLPAGETVELGDLEIY